MKLRKLCFVPICIVLFLIFSTVSFAANITVTYNGAKISFDTPPELVNGHVMVPMRTALEQLGYQVSWEEEGQYIYGKKNGTLLTLQIENPYAWIDETTVILDTPPYLSFGSAMVPLRFLAEAAGLTIDWSESTHTAALTGPQQSHPWKESAVMIQTGNIQGSGFLLTTDGVIVTNSHVLENASRLTVTFHDGTTYTGPVFLVGYDRSRDLAAIKINGIYHPAVIGNSDTVKNGDVVTAVSCPNGSLNQVSTGVVIGKNSTAIATTVTIDHGSSGGPLFNSAGEVIGILSSYSETGQTYGIPVNDLKKIPAISASLSGQTYALEPLSAFGNSASSITPTGLTVTYQNNTAYLTWNAVYDADYYLLYTSQTIDGPYKPVLNPSNGKNMWYWGFPHCFGMTGSQTAYYKIASSNGGILSPLSAPVWVHLP
ncbi:MAG: trypsin-like peptidase domain-containing protein [Clostridiales bacterium]|nr:trypsin-like peptidase domain-containing protein [Clostridiales bacterium]